MTRRDFINVAYAIRVAYPQPVVGQELETEAYYWRVRQWETDTMAMVTILKREYARFNEDVFLVACGYRRRPDGAMYGINWQTGKVA